MNMKLPQQSDAPAEILVGQKVKTHPAPTEQPARMNFGIGPEGVEPGQPGNESRLATVRSPGLDAQAPNWAEQATLNNRIRTLETLLAAERRRAEQATKAAAIRIAELERESGDRAGAIQHLEGALSHAMYVAHERAQSIEAVLKSTSWRFSAPIRMLGALKHRKR